MIYTKCIMRTATNNKILATLIIIYISPIIMFSIPFAYIVYTFICTCIDLTDNY